jgi:hypothetical protein
VLADRVRIAQIGVDAELGPVTGDDPGSADLGPAPVEPDVVDPAAAPALADAETADPEPVDEPDRQSPVDHRPATVLSPDRAHTFDA